MSGVDPNVLAGTVYLLLGIGCALRVCDDQVKGWGCWLHALTFTLWMVGWGPLALIKLGHRFHVWMFER